MIIQPQDLNNNGELDSKNLDLMLEIKKIQNFNETFQNFMVFANEMLARLQNQNSSNKIVCPPTHKKGDSKIIVFGGVENHEHLKTGHSLDLISGIWAELPVLTTRRACLSSSMVRAANKVYIFGGNDALDNVDIFDTEINESKCLNIQTVGGSSISCCYDGDDNIYLVGGFKNKTLDRIDRYNISTNSCNQIGILNIPRYFAFSFFINQSIYTIGGTYKAGSSNYSVVNTVERFSLETRKSEKIMDLDINDRIEGACYDGNDYIYFITTKQFLKLSLSKLEIIILPDIAMEGKYGVSLVHTEIENTQPRIYLLGGKSKKDHYFGLEDKRWHQIDGKPTRTYFHGSISL